MRVRPEKKLAVEILFSLDCDGSIQRVEKRRREQPTRTLLVGLVRSFMPRSQLRLPLAAVFVALVAVRHRPAGSWARRRLVAGLRSAAPQALSTTSSPPLLLAPQARWRQHAVLALPEGHWATARASTARSEVNYFASISGKLVELDAFGAPSSPRTRSAAHSAPILRTPLAGAAPSRWSMPKLTMPGRRCHRRRPLCLLPPPRRLCVCVSCLQKKTFYGIIDVYTRTPKRRGGADPPVVILIFFLKSTNP